MKWTWLPMFVHCFSSFSSLVVVSDNGLRQWDYTIRNKLSIHMMDIWIWKQWRKDHLVLSVPHDGWLMEPVILIVEMASYEYPGDTLLFAEHEACASDINELNWHVVYRGRRLSRLRSEVDKAQSLNTSLLEEIAHNKKHMWVSCFLRQWSS